MSDNGRPETTFPVDDGQIAMQHLGRPYTPNAVRFKIQAQYPKDNPTKGIVVSYVDARTVSARLNHVCGGNWSTRFESWGERESNLAVCHLTLFSVTRSDVGKGQGQDKEKAAFSDALKRAAVHFGPGAYLYSLSQIWLSTKSTQSEPALEVKTSGNKKSLVLTADCDRWLRQGYQRWLESDRNRFGPPLDHGDEPDAVGDPVELDVPEQPDLLLENRREEVKALWEESAKVSGFKSRFPKGRFEAQLNSASDEEALEKLATKVREKAAA